MKKYALTAIVDGDIIINNKVFSSRDRAIEYIFNYYSNHYNKDLSVEDEYYVGDDKHNIEYVCDYYNRFRVARVIA